MGVGQGMKVAVVGGGNQPCEPWQKPGSDAQSYGIRVRYRKGVPEAWPGDIWKIP